MSQKTHELEYYKNTLVKNLNHLLYQKFWSIRQLSDAADIPYESVKKLVGGKISNPSAYTLVKICDALTCSIDYLLGRSAINPVYDKSLPPRVFNLLTEIAYFESYLSDYNKANNSERISVLVPTGKVEDGMIFDSIYTDSVDVGRYKRDFGDIILCGYKIIGNNLMPTYYDGDILLVGKDRFPAPSETGIFLIGNKIYIRQYLPGTQLELASVNNKSKSLFIKNIDDVHYVGRVLTVIRNY